MADEAALLAEDGKSEAAYRAIGEVAAALDLPPHVLRFWETKFTQIKPLKRGGGRRFYRASDMILLGQIKELLHTRGMTIKGVQQLIKQYGRDGLAAYLADSGKAPKRDILRAELIRLRGVLLKMRDELSE